jgi:hypothetical protein
MSHGGKRSGSGRKPGAATRINEEARAKAAEGGEMPLDYMLRVMRETAAETARRDDMAKAAAPYVHAKLSQVDANAKLNLDGSITFTWQPPQES